MEIKPNFGPVLPAGDVRGPTAKDALAPATDAARTSHDAFTASPAAEPAAPAPDPSAQRLAQDPWTDVTAGSRLLISAQADAPASLHDLPLPDAVRGAVDYIFADLP